MWKTTRGGGGGGVGLESGTRSGLGSKSGKGREIKMETSGRLAKEVEMVERGYNK